jgi:hypothetical protein
VLPPFQNNVVDEEEDNDGIEEDSAVHLTDSESSPLHVTQQEYEDTLIANQFEEGDGEEIVQHEPTGKRYNLRSSSQEPKVDIPISTKKASTSGKTGAIKGVPNVQVDHTLKQPVKDSTADIRELDKNVSAFNLEHEINKIKILVPLLELLKT